MLTTQGFGTCTGVLTHVTVWSGSPQGVEEWLLIEKGEDCTRPTGMTVALCTVATELGSCFGYECWQGPTLGLDFNWHRENGRVGGDDYSGPLNGV